MLLDAHLSGRRIGPPLSQRGHDVLALDADPELAALADDLVLGFAARERRILVTRDLKDFVPLLREWAESGRSHAGCILSTLPTAAYGSILDGLEDLLAAHPEESAWVDRIEFLA